MKIYLASSSSCDALQPLLLRLKVLVQLGRPVADDPDVEADGVALLGG